MFRGGCWGNGAYDCMAGDRGGLAVDLRQGPFGLRLAAETVEAKAAREEAAREAAKARVVAAVAAKMIEVPRKKFKLCKYEVTQELWEAVMGENPSYFKGADRPVECVSWDDCQEFIKKLNALPAVKTSGLKYRLPTEEEWEFACRAGGRGKYCKLAGGAKIEETTLGRVAWYKDNSGEETHPVGQKGPNAWGLYDMHGNVWEWTSTAEDGYRVLRGGSWYNGADRCAAGIRSWYNPGDRPRKLGFRLAADGR